MKTSFKRISSIALILLLIFGFAPFFSFWELTSNAVLLSDKIAQPVEGKARVTSPFQPYYRWDRNSSWGHMGIDLGGKAKSQIFAFYQGTVTKVINTEKGANSVGNYVELKHSYGNTTFYSYYMHLYANSVKVRVGDHVQTGQCIALMGGTGGENYSYQTHLHFQINNKSVISSAGKFAINSNLNRSWTYEKQKALNSFTSSKGIVYYNPEKVLIEGLSIIIGDSVRINESNSKITATDISIPYNVGVGKDIGFSGTISAPNGLNVCGVMIYDPQNSRTNGKIAIQSSFWAPGMDQNIRLGPLTSMSFKKVTRNIKLSSLSTGKYRMVVFATTKFTLPATITQNTKTDDYLTIFDGTFEIKKAGAKKAPAKSAKASTGSRTIYTDSNGSTYYKFSGVFTENEAPKTSGKTTSSSGSTQYSYYNSSSSFPTGKYKITAKAGLNVREAPTALSKKLSTYKYDTIVEVKATDGNWGQTNKGWICLGYGYTSYISPLESETYKNVNYQLGIYKASDPAGLNYRTSPNSNAQKLGTIKQGTSFEVVTVDGSWGYCNELGGWLCLNYAEYVSVLPVRLPIPAAPTLTSNTPSELPVGDIITVDWTPCDNADSYKATLIDAASNKVIENKEGIVNTSASFVTPYEGIFNVNVVSVNAQHDSPVANMNGFEAKAPVTVTFKDWNGAVISQQTIKYGADAVAPINPERIGYSFTGWSGDYSIVRQNKEITANYTRKSYQVTFYDYDGTTVVDTQSVLYEDAATAPSYAAPTGYTFVRWDTDFSHITENTNVKAVIQWTSKYPLEISTTSSIYRNDTNYITTAIVNNSPNAVTNAKVIVSLKTAEGKELAEVCSDSISLAVGEVKTLTLTAHYEGAATVGNIFVVKADAENIPLAKHLVVAIDAGTAWSAWSTNTPPADALKTQSRTEYCYRNKQYTTSSSSSLSGWTKYNTTSAYSNWSAWSAWQDAAVSGNDLREVKTQTVTDTSKINWGGWSGWQDAPITASTLCQVETQQVPASYKTIYHYYYYTKTNSATDGNTSYYKSSAYNYGPWTVTFESELPTTTGGTSVPVTKYKWSNHHNTGKYMYVYADSPYTTNGDVISYKTQYRCRNGSYGTKTQYSYRTRTLNYTYYYYKWSDWSGWSTELQTANSDKEVQTRTTYRYISNNPANIEDTAGISRTIAGSMGASYAGSNAILHVYTADGVVQYLGQTILGADGSYSYTFKLKDEPTAASGDYYVALSVEGTTAAIALDLILAPVPEYTVTFKNADGTIIETQQVKKGENAVMPESPEIVGHIFTSWDHNGTNIQEDTTITATYEKKVFDVVFVDEINETTETKTFSYGDALVAPEIAEWPDDYTFLGWDAVIDNRLTVEDNMVVNAVYEKKTFTVNFYGYDNVAVAAYTVEYGDGVVAPELPEDGIHNFIAWNTEADFNYINENLDIYPAFDYIETTAEPDASIETGFYSSAQTVTLSCATEGAKIYYTLDGTDPLAENSASGVNLSPAKKAPANNGKAFAGTLYTEPFTLDSSAELTFVAVKDNMNSSFYETQIYAINTGAAPEEHLVTVHYGLYDIEYSFLVSDGELADIFGEEEIETGYTLKGIYTDEEHTKAWDLMSDRVRNSLDLYLVWEENTYNVTFLDKDKNVIDVQTVPYLGEAIAPEVPEVDGYSFSGWDSDYSNVYSDITVRATYVPNDLITGISLSESELILDNGKTTANLTAEVSLASDANNNHVIWQSDDETIATVDDSGTVTAVSDGETIIFAASEDSGMSAECKVYVASGCRHSYTTTVTKPSCTNNGFTTYSCARCGNTYTSDEVEKLGHRYGNWIVDKETSCTTEGHKYRICPLDNAREEAAIEKTSHVDNNGDGYCDQCNTELASHDSSSVNVCKYCGKVHNGLFGWLIKFFHSILALFGLKR